MTFTLQIIRPSSFPQAWESQNRLCFCVFSKLDIISLICRKGEAIILYWLQRKNHPSSLALKSVRAGPCLVVPLIPSHGWKPSDQHPYKKTGFYSVNPSNPLLGEVLNEVKLSLEKEEGVLRREAARRAHSHSVTWLTHSMSHGIWAASRSWNHTHCSVEGL